MLALHVISLSHSQESKKFTLGNTQEKNLMCVQCVAKPSLIQVILPSTERFIEENSQTQLQPRLLLQRPRMSNFEIFRLAAIVVFMLIDFSSLKV